MYAARALVQLRLCFDHRGSYCCVFGGVDALAVTAVAFKVVVLRFGFCCLLCGYPAVFVAACMFTAVFVAVFVFKGVACYPSVGLYSYGCFLIFAC